MGWLFFDIELSHVSAQGTAIKAKVFSRTVLAAYFPLRLLQYPKDALYLDRLRGTHVIAIVEASVGNVNHLSKTAN